MSSSPGITWTATVARDDEDQANVTITKHRRAGADSPFVTFALGRKTPLTGYGRGVEYALRRYGFVVIDGWTVVNAATGLHLVAQLEQR